jgi:hypothetical protein
VATTWRGKLLFRFVQTCEEGGSGNRWEITCPMRVRRAMQQPAFEGLLLRSVHCVYQGFLSYGLQI